MEGNVFKFESRAQKIDRKFDELRRKTEELILQNKTDPRDEKFVAMQYQRSQMTDNELADEIMATEPAACETNPTLCLTLLEEFTTRALRRLM